MKSRLGEDGYIRIFDIPRGAWVRRSPVDAREYLKLGTGSLDGPVVVATRDGDVKNICTEQVDQFCADGWDVEAPKPAKTPEALDPAKQGNREPSSHDFEQYNVPDLKRLATMANLEGFSNMKRSVLVEALVKTGFAPTDEQLEEMGHV